MSDTDTLVREFLAGGGKVERCPPGGSEHVQYKHSGLFNLAQTKARAECRWWQSLRGGRGNYAGTSPGSELGQGRAGAALAVDTAMRQGLVE